MGREEILLKEYEVCQQASNANASSYWIMAGIFFGITSALLGGLLYAILSNERLFPILIETVTTINAPSTPISQSWILRILVTVMGIGAIILLHFLKRWLKRITFLSRLNFERMREIELELGMWKSWRVHAVDQWQEQNVRKDYDKEFDDNKRVWNKLEKELKKDLNTKYAPLLNEREWGIVQLFRHYHPKGWWHRLKNKARYEQPSSKFHAKWISRTLLALWAIFIASVWLVPFTLYHLN